MVNRLLEVNVKRVTFSKKREIRAMKRIKLRPKQTKKSKSVVRRARGNRRRRR